MKITKDLVVPLKPHKYSYELVNLLLALTPFFNPLAAYLKQGSISRLANQYPEKQLEPKPTQLKETENPE